MHYASVAQLDRAPDFGSGGSGFDSLQARQIKYYKKFAKKLFPHVN